MKRISLAGLTLLLAAVTILIIWSPTQSAPPSLDDAVHRLNLSVQYQDFGWQVCAIGGMTNVPGVGQRQQVELCHDEGWRINTYCLDPGQPVPELGTICSRVEPGSDEFWCGDNVQGLVQLAVLQTPAPQDTRTPTPTSTSTPTVTLTITPATTRTAQPQNEESPTATPYRRPQAGGPGNLEMGIVLFLMGGAATGGWFLMHRHRKIAW